MADDVIEGVSLDFKLQPHDYADALKNAFSALQVAHRIIVSYVETRDITFADVEDYLQALDTLQSVCGCAGVQSTVFLDEIADSWIES